MSAAKHTPGPWVCQAAYGNHGLRIDSEAGGTLGHVRAFIPSGEIRHGAEVLTRWEEGFANARLIEAAPKLLASLKLILTRWDGCDADDTPPAVEAAREVVAKAEGSKA